EPLLQRAGIGCAQAGVAGVPRQVDDGLGSQTAVEVVVEQYFWHSPNGVQVHRCRHSTTLLAVTRPARERRSAGAKRPANEEVNDRQQLTHNSPERLPFRALYCFWFAPLLF